MRNSTSAAALGMLLAATILSVPAWAGNGAAGHLGSSVAAPKGDLYPDGLRKWSSADSVQLTRYLTKDGPPYIGQHGGIGSDAIFVSPDAKYIFFVTRRGDVNCLCQVGVLSVYSVAEIERALSARGDVNIRPIRSVKKQGFMFPIQGPEWSGDSHSILFSSLTLPTGASRTTKQYFKLDVATGQLTQLTHAKDGTNADGYQTSGSGVIYRESWDSWEVLKPRTMPFAASPEIVDDLFRGTKSQREMRLVASWNRGAPWRLHSKPFSFAVSQYKLSPDGRYLVGVRSSAAVLDAAGDGLPEFFIADLKLRTEASLIDAQPSDLIPLGPFAARGPLWAADGKSVILPNVSLPVEIRGEQRPDVPYIVSFDLKTKRTTILQPGLSLADGSQVTDVHWVEQGRKLLVVEDGGLKNPGYKGRKIYEIAGGQWKGRDATSDELRNMEESAGVGKGLPDGLHVALRQGPNEPFKIVASRGNREVLLSEPDPVLRYVWIAPTVRFSYIDGDGNTQEAGLTLPRYLPEDGTKIPLVIQGEPFIENEFNPDGSASAGVATQALASQGFAILNIGNPEDDIHRGRYSEAKSARAARLYTDWVESAAEALALKYPIDLDRIGLVGWSFSGFTARYAATFASRVRPRAVVMADSSVQGYQEYLDHCADRTSACKIIPRHHGGDFFQAKQAWLRNDVEFNADRSRAAMLYTNHVVSHLTGGVGRRAQMQGEILDLAQRPYESYFIPAENQGHVLTEPGSRMISLNATVDWFNFWLQNKETPRSEDPDRYARWHRLKDRWEKQQAWEARGYPVASLPGDPDVINGAAYRALYEDKDIPKALRFFQENVNLHPENGSVYDSLAEGYLLAGDIANAIVNYERAAAIAPKANPNAAPTAAALKAEPKRLPELQQRMRQAYADYIMKRDGPIGGKSQTADVAN